MRHSMTLIRILVGWILLGLFHGGLFRLAEGILMLLLVALVPTIIVMLVYVLVTWLWYGTLDVSWKWHDDEAMDGRE